MSLPVAVPAALDRISDIGFLIGGTQSPPTECATLLRNTDIGTIFVDPHVNIRKSTKAATRYFSLVDHDIGGCLCDFAHTLPYDSLEQLIRNVIETEVTYVSELVGKGGEQIILKILPNKSRTNHLGAILNLIDLEMFRQVSDFEEDDD